MDIVEPAAWRERCAQRIRELEGQMPETEARRLAAEVHAFERTRAMPPEEAAEFVALEMSRAERARFERRAAPR